MVGDSSKRNPGSSPGDDVDVGGYVAETTGDLDVAGPTGKAVEPLAPGCPVPRVQDGREREREMKVGRTPSFEKEYDGMVDGTRAIQAVGSRHEGRDDTGATGEA